MAQFYTDPTRETDDHALPNAETFRAHYGDCPDCGQVVQSPDCTTGACYDCGDRVVRLGQVGWFWWACFPGCLPDGEPMGPFETEQAAIDDARDGLED